jgi:hypothetical protein
MTREWTSCCDRKRHGSNFRGYFRDGDRERDARILELLEEIKPTPDEHAAIVKHSTEIGAVIEMEFNQK